MSYPSSVYRRIVILSAVTAALNGCSGDTSLQSGGPGGTESSGQDRCQSTSDCHVSGLPCKAYECSDSKCVLVSLPDGPLAGAEDTPGDCRSAPSCQDGELKQNPDVADSRKNDGSCVVHQCIEDDSGKLTDVSVAVPQYTDTDDCNGQSTCDGAGECKLKPREACKNQDGSDCASGICEAKECSKNKDCPGNECKSGRCVNDMTCRKGTYDPCFSVADCASSHTCSTAEKNDAGICMKEKDEPCDSSKECVSGLCAGGKCVKCSNVNACNAGYSCTGGECTLTCSADVPCPPGYGPDVCDANVPLCLPSCSDDTNPCSAGESCVNSFCVPADP